MGKLFFTLLTLACALVIAYFTFNFNGNLDTHDTIAVSGAPIEVLFEHTSNQETFMLYRTVGGDDLSLAYLTRSLTGLHLRGSATQYELEALTEAAGLNYVVLPQSDGVPRTVFAGITDNPDLEVFVTEPHFAIAHGIRVFESEVSGLYVWMVMSPDFFGEQYTITAVDLKGLIVGDMEYDGAQRTFFIQP